MFTKSKIWFCQLSIAGLILAASGCATTKTSNTARTGAEQILISSAIDRAMSNVRFGDFAGYNVFIDDKYLDGTVDKGYLVGSLRHRVLSAGGKVAAAADKADVVLEVRSGGVGTDNEETFIGIPAIGIPGLPIELPEVKIANRTSQIGTAKIGLIAYNPKTGEAMGKGGRATALTHSNDTYVLGVGPFRNGAVVDTRERAIGFAGVGGSLMSSASQTRRYPVAMVDQAQSTFASTPPATTGDFKLPTLPASAKINSDK